jgi:hypothetical protein
MCNHIDTRPANIEWPALVTAQAGEPLMAICRLAEPPNQTKLSPGELPKGLPVLAHALDRPAHG